MALIQKIIHALLYVHPPHTLVVHFPIALITTALFFILLAWWRKSDLLEKIAFADLSLGALSTVVAGAFGIHDNIVLYGGQAPNHTAKIILAISLFFLTTITVLIRWRKPELFHSRGKAWYILSYFVSFLLVTVLGFLGGVIVYGM